MKAAGVLLGLVLILDVTFAAEESCAGVCGSFETQRKCQCDSMCIYYESCCSDFYTVCPKRARGDTFADPDEVTETVPSPTNLTPTFPTTTVKPTVPAFPTYNTTSASPASGDPDAAPCSGRPFDAFLQLKNGSIYAFRGEYFFELDDLSVLPGYPKLIQDVWGISGPISAAFTRINCQGKSYIFKGNQYWRFEGDVLDEDFPRDISVGFDGIPNDVDAVFAVPAPSHRGKEKAYFFKGDKYYQYEFKHQPSHGECVQMSRSSPSVLFSQYTDVYCDETLENLFQKLFEDPFASYQMGPRLISRDWHGIKAPVDAAMVGRVHLTPKPTPPSRLKFRTNRRRRPSRRQRGRQTRSIFDDLFSFDDVFDFTPVFEENPTQEYKATPLQNVYFFQRDKYYRASLQTKWVATAYPPYPRSIAKYWLGCEQEDKPDTARAEKR